MNIKSESFNKIRPEKRWGQHFLRDKNLAQAIVYLHNPKEDEVHLEIGAGTGQLTGLLLERCKLLIAVEIDRRLVEVLLERFYDKENLVILCQDILKTDLKQISSAYRIKGQKLRVIGNLPFNISSPLLHHLIKFRKHIKDMTLMVQREVAERIVAQPGSKQYGYLSLMVNLYCDAKICRKIPGQVFYPRPKIEAVILRLIILEKPRLHMAKEDFFFQVIKSSFSHRRKTISNALLESGLLPLSKDKISREIARADIEPDRRAESLSLNEFFQIYKKLIKYARD